MTHRTELPPGARRVATPLSEPAQAGDAVASPPAPTAAPAIAMAPEPTRDAFERRPRSQPVGAAPQPLRGAFTERAQMSESAARLDPARLPAKIRALLNAPSDELRHTLGDWVSRFA